MTCYLKIFLFAFFRTCFAVKENITEQDLEIYKIKAEIALAILPNNLTIIPQHLLKSDQSLIDGSFGKGTYNTFMKEYEDLQKLSTTMIKDAANKMFLQCNLMKNSTENNENDIKVLKKFSDALAFSQAIYIVKKIKFSNQWSDVLKKIKDDYINNRFIDRGAPTGIILDYDLKQF